MPGWVRTVAAVVSMFYFVAGGFLFYMWKIGKATYGFAKVEYRADSLAYINSWKTTTKILHGVAFAIATVIAFGVLDN